MIWESTRVERERSDEGKRGLKAGQSGGGFAGVTVLALDFGGSDFLGGMIVGLCGSWGMVDEIKMLWRINLERELEVQLFIFYCF
jgi:hypothetical protein